MSLEDEPEMGETARGRTRPGHLLAPVVGICLVAFLLLTTGLFTLLEIPLRFFFGWVFHLWRLFPELLPQWPGLLLPLACFSGILWLVHRFMRWWFQSRRSPHPWHLAHTAAVVSLIMLGSLAAIALSGIAHQLVWLGQDKFLTNGRGKDHVAILNQSRQLWLAMDQFRQKEGRLPVNLQELEASHGLQVRIDPGNGRAEETFVLVAGRNEIPRWKDEHPWLLSPRIQNSAYYVVAFESGRCTLVGAREVEEWLEGRARGESQPSPASDE